MNNIPDDVVTNPHKSWIEKLRNGNTVYLVKEQSYANISSRYQNGNIGICLLFKHERFADYKNPKNGSWHVNPDGTGFDGSLLMLPLKNTYAGMHTDASATNELRLKYADVLIGQEKATIVSESPEQSEINKLKTKIIKFEHRLEMMYDMISCYLNKKEKRKGKFK